MSQTIDAELHRLRQVADEIRATFAVEGFSIDRGLDANEAFKDGEAVRSSMIRKLAYRAAARGAQNAGLDCVTITGGGREIESYVGNVLRHHRVLRVSGHDENGDPLVLASSRAILEFDGEILLREERYVFAYAVTNLNTIGSVFTAKVLDVEGDNPGKIILGPITYLEPIGTGPSGFRPAEEDLDGFDEDEETGS